jgi:hypothetical protein
MFDRSTGTLKNLYTEFHKNLTGGLAAVIRSQTDGQTRRQTWCPHKAFFVTTSWRISEDQTPVTCIFLIKLLAISEWSMWCYELGSGLKRVSLGAQRRKSKLSAWYLTTIRCVRWTVGYMSRIRMGSYCAYNGSGTHTVHCVCGLHLAGSRKPVRLGFRSIRKWLEFLRHCTGRSHCEWSWPFMCACVCVCVCVCTCIYVCTFLRPCDRAS